MSVYVRQRAERWEVVTDAPGITVAVLFQNVAKFRAIEYAARLLDIPTSVVEVRE